MPSPFGKIWGNAQRWWCHLSPEYLLESLSSAITCCECLSSSTLLFKVCDPQGRDLTLNGGPGVREIDIIINIRGQIRNCLRENTREWRAILNLTGPNAFKALFLIGSRFIIRSILTNQVTFIDAGKPFRCEQLA